jgi:hypothetical protein
MYNEKQSKILQNKRLENKSINKGEKIWGRILPKKIWANIGQDYIWIFGRYASKINEDMWL